MSVLTCAQCGSCPVSGVTLEPSTTEPGVHKWECHVCHGVNLVRHNDLGLSDPTATTAVVASTPGEQRLLERWRQTPHGAQRLLFACLGTLAAKGADYTMGKADRLANFREGAGQLGEPFTMRHVWAVYAWKHWTAVIKWCRHGQVESEPVWTRIMDLIVYLVLLLMIAEEAGEPGPPAVVEKDG